MAQTTLAATDLVDHTGMPLEVPLSGYSHTVVYLMRSADCPACKKHVNELVKHAQRFQQKGTGIVVVVPDGVSAASELSTSLDDSLTVATSASFHEAVGLQEKLFGKVRQSGVFLINQSGKVLYSRTATLPPMSLKIKELSAAVSKHADR